MGEAKRRKDLGNYPEQTKKPVRKPKRQIEREVRREVAGLLGLYHEGMKYFD